MTIQPRPHARSDVSDRVDIRRSPSPGRGGLAPPPSSTYGPGELSGYPGQSSTLLVPGGGLNSPYTPQSANSTYSSSSSPRHRAHTVADANVIHTQYHQRSPAITMQQNPYQQGRGIPPPPPPPHSQTPMGMALPPPPPRQFNQGQFVLPPPPPTGGPPATPISYGWPRQPTYPPPPMSATPMAYNPNAYQNYGQHTQYAGQQQHQLLQQQQLQQLQQRHQHDNAPLVSATFIPGPDSLGIGVGIPPLYTPTEASSDHSSFFPDPDTYTNASTASRGTNITIPDDVPYHDRTYQREVTVPGRGQSGYHSPGPPTATLQNPQHPSSQDSHSRTPISPSDPATQWPLDRVLLWLAGQGYSQEWQEAFKSLNIYGQQFLDLGKATGRGGGIAFMHQIVMPQLARECTANQVPWDQAKGRDEGKRIRKLIKGILDNGGNAPFSAGGSHRRDNSLTSAGEGEDSPNVNQRSGSTPTTAGAGDDSPGNYYAPMSSTSPHGGHFGRRGSQQRNVTMPLSGQLHDHISENGRSTYAETMLRNVGDNYGKRHSPSPSRDQNTFNAPRHASPQHSPALQSAHPVDSANGRTFSSGHFRTGSSEASGRPRHGTEGSRPSPLDIGVHSDRDTPASAKEHKHFFPRFSRKKKEEHTEDSSTSIDSPTSPATHRTLLPFSKHNNTSQTSIGSGILASTSVAVRPVVPRDTDEPKSYAMATYDGWNYRLVDISYAESPLVIRQTVCENLGIAYSSEVTLYITTPGQADHDEPLFDDLLVHARRTMADKDGTLRIWVNFPGSVPSAGLGLGLSTGMQPNHKRSQATDQSRGRGNSNISVESPSVRSDGESTLVPGQGDALRNLLNKNHSPVETVRQPAGIRTWNDGQVSDAERAMSLSHAAEMYRQQTEQKREAYLEGRRRQLSKGSPTDAPSGPGIRGRAVDFDDKDKKRKTPYDQKDYKPMRDPPPVPPDTNTLIKANSLTKKGGQRLRNSWGDDDESIGKRRSHESDRPKSSGSVRMQGSPLRREESNGQRSMASALGAANRLNGSPGGSPRSPALTRSPGNVDFRVPDFYGEEPTDFELNGSESQESTLTQTTANAVKAASINRTGSGNKPELKLQTKMTHPGIARAKSSEYGRRGSPEVSPSTEQPLNRMISKRGPTHDFQEANISFTDRGSAGAEASDSDSDDGLFAMRIRKTDQTSSTATPTPGPSKPTQQDDGEERRPSLSLDTNSNNVRFESPVRSAVPQSASTDSPADDMKRFESGLERDGVRIPQSAASTTWSPEEPISFNRRESFASDVWANRPPAEALVEHLDEFFPNVNLDQPVMEEELGGTPTSPGGTQGPSATFNLGRSGTPMSSLSENEEYEDGIGSLNRGGFTSIAQRNMRKSGGLGRTKSIRDVVKDAYTPGSRNSFVGAPAPARVNTLKQAAEGAIMRRKSTKMFGAKIEQVKPQRQSRLIQLETIPQDTLPVPNRQPTFKWMKGQLIGKGTFGRVYLGMNMTTGELIAVKQVEVNPKAHGQDKEKMTEMVKSLDVEIDTMKDLDHPNIVSYLGSEKKDYSISIFLEYIPGGSVGSCLRKHGKFEESIVSSLTRQTLSALAYLHREGVLHRDLKSDNILLDLDGTCKISDFGISKKTDDIYGNDVTNSMQGSVFWMAPEVIRSQGQGYSAKVDVWSLGCVVLEMFAGRRPWSKEEAIGAIYKLGSLNEAPPIPDDVSSDISPQAISFMYDCFTIDPGERPTADTLLRSPFCFLDPRYNFLDTDLYAKIRGAF